MKANFKMIGAGLMMSGLLVVGGCGSDNNYTAAPASTGKVVKGPVNGATVTATNGAKATTALDGSYSVAGTGPFTSTGGMYVPLKADGTAGTPVAAPTMSCPVGVTQITPISTLVQQATVAAAATGATDAQKKALTDLLAVVNANGGLNVDLSTKTAANTALLTLSETVGAVLATANSTSTAALTAATNALITAVAAIPTTSTLASLSTAALTTALNTAVQTAATALTTAGFATVATAATTAVTTAITGTTAAPVGALPTSTKTGTGGSGGSGF